MIRVYIKIMISLVYIKIQESHEDREAGRKKKTERIGPRVPKGLGRVGGPTGSGPAGGPKTKRFRAGGWEPKVAMSDGSDGPAPKKAKMQSEALASTVPDSELSDYSSDERATLPMGPPPDIPGPAGLAKSAAESEHYFPKTVVQTDARTDMDHWAKPLRRFFMPKVLSRGIFVRLLIISSGCAGFVAETLACQAMSVCVQLFDM